jgi:phosphoribosylformylglycinamidine cyclo-ligase
VATYRGAGVDLDAAADHVSAIGPLVQATWGNSVLGGFGGFAAGIEIPDEYTSPVLMMSTDGVGTKLEIARRADIWEGVGFDLVAMCVDDLTAVGANPLGFVDYMAVGALHPDRDRAIVASIAAACRDADCALLGGETAEHPGVMDSDSVDLAGAVAGVVEKGETFGPHRVEPGDIVIGLRSPNLRSNGFSLIRRLFPQSDDDQLLLEPSVIYSRNVLAVARQIKSAAHVTGGGLPGNLPRALPPGLGVEIDTSTWHPPEIFERVQSRGVSPEEMFATFNMGIGFCLVVSPGHGEEVIAALSDHDPKRIGTVTTTTGFRLI